MKNMFRCIHRGGWFYTCCSPFYAMRLGMHAAVQSRTVSVYIRVTASLSLCINPPIRLYNLSP